MISTCLRCTSRKGESAPCAYHSDIHTFQVFLFLQLLLLFVPTLVSEAFLQHSFPSLPLFTPISLFIFFNKRSPLKHSWETKWTILFRRTRVNQVDFGRYTAYWLYLSLVLTIFYFIFGKHEEIDTEITKYFLMILPIIISLIRTEDSEEWLNCFTTPPHYLLEQRRHSLL